MRITRIDLEGKPGRHATIHRQAGARYIYVTILTPEFPNGRKHPVEANNEEERWSMAECLQELLDGCRGTNSMIHDYLSELERFAD